MNIDHDIAVLLLTNGYTAPTAEPGKEVGTGLPTKAKAILTAQRDGKLRQFVVFELTAGWGYCPSESVFADHLDREGQIFPGVEPIQWFEYDLDKQQKIRKAAEPIEQITIKQRQKTKSNGKRKVIDIDNME